MKTIHRQNLLAVVLSCALGATTAYAQTESGFYRPLTLAPADIAASGGGGANGEAEDQQAELAKKLNNPISSLISVPIQNNWDFGIGSEDAMRYTANIQPVIPISISTDWNLIVRTILPVIYAEGTTPGASSKAGLGDTVQSFFFSPKAPTSGGWIWGAGPVALWPTSTDDALGTGKVGAGPTGVLLKQSHGWTYGILANHIWSYAGQGDTPDVNATFLQPFVSFTTKTYTTFALNTESTYDWDRSQWTVPLNLMVAQLLKIGGHPVQFQIGYRYYAERPNGGPDWGLRFAVTFFVPEMKHPSRKEHIIESQQQPAATPAELKGDMWDESLKPEPPLARSGGGGTHTMMSSRLGELRRVLKPTGSLDLHCDPTASHYLKLLAAASAARGVHAASTPEREATSKRAKARAPENISLVRIIGEPTTPNEAAWREAKGIERLTSAAAIEETFKKAPGSRKQRGEQEELKI